MAPFFIDLYSFLAVFSLKIDQPHRKNGAISERLVQMTIRHAWTKDTMFELNEWLNGAVFSLYFYAEKLTFLAFFDENPWKINGKFTFWLMLTRKWRHSKYNVLIHVLAYFRHKLKVWRHPQTFFGVWNGTKFVMAPFL